MIVGVFTEIHPSQELFKEQYDAKFCVKEIKGRDSYLGYIAYAYFNYINGIRVDICTIMKELIRKYNTRVEGYLFYWNVLSKADTYIDHKAAYNLSAQFYKNCLSIKFDDPIS
jgi:hypothetical protein